MKKIFKRIHLWLAIPASIFIMLICATGTIMVFQTEIQECVYKQRFFNDEQGKTKMNLDSLVKVVDKQLVNDTVKSLKIYKNTSRNIVASLASGGKMYAYINPYSGNVVEVNNARSGFFHVVMTLHRWLMLPNRTVGKMIIGVSTIFLIIILVTGIVRWWPKKKFSRGLKFNWKHANLYRKFFDLHKVLGVYSSVFLIIMSLTGLMWSFQWYRNGVFNLFGQSPNVGTRHTYRSNNESNELSWENAYNQTVNDNKEFVSITPHGEAKDKSSIMRVNYAIHVGSWGGIITKIIWFIASLIGFTLPITGYVLYLRPL